jgi:hypothetical protein
MPTKHPPIVADDTEDGMSQYVKKKLERGILSTTTTKDRPKRNVTKPDRQNVAPLLAEYASATISKTAAKGELGINHGGTRGLWGYTFRKHSDGKYQH